MSPSFTLTSSRLIFVHYLDPTPHSLPSSSSLHTNQQYEHTITCIRHARSRTYISPLSVVCLAGKVLEVGKCNPHNKCVAGTFTKAVGTSSSQPVCESCRVGYYKTSESATSTETDECGPQSTCKQGEWIVNAGTTTTDTQCRNCSFGRFRASHSPANKLEDETVVCKEHRKCSAGEWTAKSGTVTSDTQCLACSNGRFRLDAPVNKSKEASEVVACTGVHKNCSRGEWTEAAGTSTRDTQCKACGNGFFRAQAPTTNKLAETKDVLCIEHTKCKAGTFTKKAGSSTSEPTCQTCKSGFFKANTSRSSVETDVCIPLPSTTAKASTGTIPASLASIPTTSMLTVVTVTVTPPPMSMWTDALFSVIGAFAAMLVLIILIVTFVWCVHSVNSSLA